MLRQLGSAAHAWLPLDLAELGDPVEACGAGSETRCRVGSEFYETATGCLFGIGWIGSVTVDWKGYENSKVALAMLFRSHPSVAADIHRALASVQRPKAWNHRPPHPSHTQNHTRRGVPKQQVGKDCGVGSRRVPTPGSASHRPGALSPECSFTPETLAHCISA